MAHERIEGIVRAAGGLALKTRAEGLRVETKADGTPVTNVDLAVSGFLIDKLREAYPSAGIISEEIDDASGLAKAACWIVDPIDGTKYLVEGRDDWRVMAALVEKGEPTVAAIYFPVRDVFLYAERGKGAFRTAGGVTERLALPKRAPPWRYAHARRSLRKAGEQLLTDSIALTLSIIDGDLDCFLFGPHKYWDAASPHLLALEAGGAVRLQDGGEARYTDASLTLPSFAVGRPEAVAVALASKPVSAR